ncbi:topoisomerase II-associated protein PAT1 [Gaertneriomyces semiglobifer]|nr:topoisomerase II-associated protein PAT1 [Gaertneriomyces semiglobifer]
MASFFGFDTKLPGRDGAGDGGVGGLNLRPSDIDEQLERKYEYGLEGIEDDGAVGGLEDDDMGLNDETFGDAAAVDKIDTEFDFVGGTARMGDGLSAQQQQQQQRPQRDYGVERRQAGQYQPEPSYYQQQQHRGREDHGLEGFGRLSIAEEQARRPSQLSKQGLAQIWNKPTTPTGYGGEGMPYEVDSYARNVPQGHNMMPVQQPQQQQPRPMSLEEIEAQVMRHARGGAGMPMSRPPGEMTGRPRTPADMEAMRNLQMQAYPPHQGPPGPQGQGDRRFMSVSELEAAMRQQQPPRPMESMMPPRGMMYPPGPPDQHQIQQIHQMQGGPLGPGPVPGMPMMQGLMQGGPPPRGPPQFAGQDPRQVELEMRQAGTPPRGQVMQQGSPLAAESGRDFQPPQFEQQYDRRMYDRDNFQRPPMQLGQFFPPQQQGRFMPQHQGGRPQQGYQRNDYGSQQQQQQQPGRFQNSQNQRRDNFGNRPDIRTREEKYRGLMQQYEKELIAKIQISQLVTDDPYRDDFYYKIFTSLTAAQNQNQQSDGSTTSPKDQRKPYNWQQSQLLDQTRGSSSVTGRMQQQMKRLIEGRKTKTKSGSLSLEGALGKISSGSARAPRQVLQVPGATKENTEAPPPGHQAVITPRQTLKRIEALYAVVLELEVLKRKGPAEETPEAFAEWNDKVAEFRQKMVHELGIEQPVPLTWTHPFIETLKWAKGIRLVPRLFRSLEKDQALTVLSTLLARLDQIAVFHTVHSPQLASFGVNAQQHAEQTELFSTNVIPTVVSVVMDLPLFIVNACVRVLLQRCSVLWVCGTRLGLAVMSVFLSRAEMVKQGGESGNELNIWNEIYNYIFTSLHGHFASLFPAASDVGGSSAPTGGQGAHEVYVWQFLAAMAVGATGVEHQRVLLTEVREKVLETARRTDDAKALDNVNLFLNALGLGIDAKALAGL